MRTLVNGFEWLRIRMTLVRDERSKPVRAVCTAQRINEYKYLENRFSTTLRQNKIASWRYDIARHTVVLNTNTSYKFFHDENGEIPNVPQSQIDEGLCHLEDIEILRRLYKRLDAGEQNVEETLRFKSSNIQGFRWMKCVYTVINDKKGISSYAIGSAIDVTDQIEAERQYMAAVEYRKHTQTENLLFSGHCSVTQDKIIEMTNLTGLDIAGQMLTGRRSEFFAKLREYIIDENKKQEYDTCFTNEGMQRNFELGIHEASLTCEVCFDGQKQLWVNFHVNAVRTPDIGDLEGFLTITDVTEQHFQETLLKTVVEYDYDYIMVADVKEGTYKLYSASNDISMVDTPHTGEYEAQLMAYAQKNVLPSDYSIAVDQMKIPFLMEKLSDSKVYELSCRVVYPDGSARYKQMRASFLDERHMQLLITRSDINSLIMEEENKRSELTAALRLAENATKAKTEFFARMSHDMRTPLNGILGSVNLALDEEKISPRMAEYLCDIKFSGSFLLTLINDVLDMSKIESGAMELSPEEYTYSEFISNMTKMIAPLCRTKNITLNMNPIENGYTIRVDIMRFQQIFFNIFSNAVKYTPEGGRIDHYMETELLDEHHIDCKCHIIDNGIGMSKEYLEHLFEPYYRENRTNYAAQGTGLGLSIANSLAHMMGGEITVKSKLGKGTEVVIHMVLELAHRQETAKPEDGTAHACGSLKTAVGVKQDAAQCSGKLLCGKRILLCEDNKLNAKIALRLLAKWGAQTDHAENGEIGTKLFEDSEIGYYSLILMDIRMPVMDGLCAAEKIRSLPRADATAVPIIAMTANAYEEDKEKSRLVGMNEHLSKPIEPNLLLETIVKYL